MGCCLTTTAVGAAADDSKTNSRHRDAPPPPPPAAHFEEETVKEVLSETPVTFKKPSSFSSTPTKITAGNEQIEREFRSKNVVLQLTKHPVQEDASEVSSEMYTCSASFSAATATTVGTGTIDEDGEVTQKVKKLPPPKPVSRRQPTIYSGERARKKERGIMTPPPARRSAVPSTNKKPQFPSRNTQRHRNVAPASAIRREPPARKSRSPGQVMKLKERSPVGKSGNRVPLNVTENKGNVKLKKINDGGSRPEAELEPRESLENPRVSLECFIFL